MKPIPRSQFLPAKNRHSYNVYGRIRQATNPAEFLLFQEVLPEVLERIWQRVEVLTDEIINGPFHSTAEPANPSTSQGFIETLLRPERKTRVQEILDETSNNHRLFGDE